MMATPLFPMDLDPVNKLGQAVQSDQNLSSPSAPSQPSPATAIKRRAPIACRRYVSVLSIHTYLSYVIFTVADLEV